MANWLQKHFGAADPAQAERTALRRELDSLYRAYAEELTESRRMAAHCRQAERQRDRAWQRQALIPAAREDWNAAWRDVLVDVEDQIVDLHRAQAEQMSLLSKLRSAIVRLEEDFSRFVQAPSASTPAWQNRHAQRRQQIADVEARFAAWKQRLARLPAAHHKPVLAAEPARSTALTVSEGERP